MIKTFPAELVAVVRSRRGQRNLRVLARFFLVLAVMITAYSVMFHVLMLREGQDHTWITGFYWTLTVMSTLGFGDITFHTDIGRLFSILVLLSGTIVIAAGQVNDVRLYRDLIASGIHDYLLKPFTVDQVRDTFAHAQSILSGPRGEQQQDDE